MTEHDDHLHGDGPHPGEQPQPAWWHPRSLLSAPAASVAAFAVAFLMLDGQNLLIIGVQSLLGQGFWSTNQAAGYYVVWGISALLPLLVVGWLAGVTLRTARSGWEAHLSRAAVLLAVLAFAGAVLTAIGGLLHNGMA